MAGASIIWISNDRSEQVAHFNNEYVLTTIADMKRTPLGETLEEAKDKLIEIGRCDICQQIK